MNVDTFLKTILFPIISEMKRIYFRLTNTNVAKTDNDLYIIVEYLDNNTTGIAVEYGMTHEIAKACKTPTEAEDD